MSATIVNDKGRASLKSCRLEVTAESPTKDGITHKHKSDWNRANFDRILFEVTQNAETRIRHLSSKNLTLSPQSKMKSLEILKRLRNNLKIKYQLS